MAKTFSLGGKTVTTDQDGYEIDAFGKRASSARHTDDGMGGVFTDFRPAPRATAAPPTIAPPAPSPSLSGIGAATGMPGSAPGLPSGGGASDGTDPAMAGSLAGLQSAMSGGVGDMMGPGGAKPLGTRLYPKDSMDLAGRKIY